MGGENEEDKALVLLGNAGKIQSSAHTQSPPKEKFVRLLKNPCCSAHKIIRFLLLVNSTLQLLKA